MKQQNINLITQTKGLWGVMRPVIGKIRWAICLGALCGASSLTATVLLAFVIDALLQPQPEPWLWVILALVFTVIAIVLKGVAFTISHLGAFKLETVLRMTMAEHLAKVSLGFLLQSGSGTLNKILQDDVKNLHAFVADSTPFLGRAVAIPIITLLMMIYIDWRLALAAVAILLLGMFMMSLAMKDNKELSERYDAERENITNTVIEFVQAMPVVRTFDDGESSFGRYQQALNRFHAVLSRWLICTGTAAKSGLIILSPLPTLIILFAVGGWFYAAGQLSFSVWLTVLLIGSGVAESLMPLMWLHNFIRKAQASALRIQSLLTEPELPVCIQPQTPQDASVVFESVNFAYEKRKQNALQNISFSVPAGTVTALVGPSGAGKSTVAKLIPRFWDVTAGAIKIGGVDVRNITPETLMSHVSFVFQDTFLFHDTLANNISLGIENATQQEIESAAKAAQADEFIQQLPQGYDTVAGDRGTRLSGGQRQRITIARAIMQNRPIVVLDEATAFADPENEAALIHALANLMRNKTVIVIAHRLASIKDADQIVVFDKGETVEIGTHTQLVNKEGVYSRLWHNYELAQTWSLSQENIEELR